MRRLLALIFAGFLTACATATPYAPVGTSGYGFTEKRIEQNRVSISFKGNSLTDRETVEDYLIFHAAELTLEGGYDHFIVATRLTDPKKTYSSLGSPAGFYRWYPDYYYFSPRFGWRSRWDPFWDDLNVREVTRYEASAEIAMFKGPKPAGDANAFDARDVKSNLEAKIVRPVATP